MNFEGRVCVVTGAASGIGRALAVELAERGSDLALCDVNVEELEATARMVETRGRRVSYSKVNVAERSAMSSFAEGTLEAHGRVDAIVNNAGVSLSATVAEMSYEDFEWIMDINFWGVIHGTTAFLPHLLEQGDGQVVNISSIFGIVAFPGQSAYNAAKFAVRGYTESLRQELEGTGVSALCVHPGGVKTRIARDGRFRSTPDGTDRETAVRNFEDVMARTTAEEAAKTIADAMARREARVLVGTDAVVMEAIQRVAPVRYPAVFRAAESQLGSRVNRRQDSGKGAPSIRSAPASSSSTKRSSPS